MCGKNDIVFAVATKAMALLMLASICFYCGCSGELADLMDDGPTATEAKLILDNGSEIRATPDVSNPLPEIYRQPPEVLKTSKGWKLFYYARNHPPKTLSHIMKGQLKNNVSVADDTNQLIVNCADQADVDMVLAYLENVDVSPIQVKVDCIVVENYANVTMDRETRVKVGDIVDDDGFLMVGPDDGWGSFPGASIRESRRSDMGMSIGYNSDDLKFLIDMLVSRGYLKVLMNPSVETTTGKKAIIISKDRMPRIKQVTDTKTQEDYEVTEYIDIIDSLEVTPQVYADASVSLACKVKISSKNTPEGVAQLPIVTERTINLGSSRLEPGKSLVVGGFRKSEKSSVIRGFPFLKDIPIIGVIFSSRDFEERAKEITFILTPSVSSNGIPYSQMLENLAEEQFNEADPNDIKASINKALADPFGNNAYTDEIGRNREIDSINRLRAEILTAETEIEAEVARQKLKRYEEKLRLEKEITEKASQQQATYQKNIVEVEKVIKKLTVDVEAQKVKYKALLEKTQTDTKATKQDAVKLKEQAENIKQQLEKKQTDLEKSINQKQLLDKEKEELLGVQKKLREQIEQVEKEVLELTSQKEEAQYPSYVAEDPSQPQQESQEAKDAE